MPPPLPDLVLTGGRIVNVLTAEIERLDVAIAGGRVAAVGPALDGRRAVDLDGSFLAPGLIDAHVHIESSMVPPAEFGRVVLPHGVTTVVADPHEIANVNGADGVRFMAAQSEKTPLRIELMAPSCVPASALATSGARLDAAALVGLRDECGLLGLAEMMNYPGAVAGDPDVLEKLAAFEGAPRDGHCPGLTGPALATYVARGIGSDHESTTADEAREKVRAGLTVFIRQGSAARDLLQLLPAVTPDNERSFAFCTDDRHLYDLIGDGSIDALVREAIAAGLEPMTALRLATLNPAEHFELRDRGAIAPGRFADLFSFRRLEEPVAERVWVGGAEVSDRPSTPSAFHADTFRVDPDALSFRIPIGGSSIRVIRATEDRLITDASVEACSARDGNAVADPARDLLKLAVIERHRGTGNVGLGFVHGLGLARGAIASSVAHDHHNVIVAGCDDESMLAAARTIIDSGGGVSAAAGDETRAFVPLPIAGLMSDRPFPEVARGLETLAAAARTLGSPLRDPFMTLSFLGLEVIPHLKLTDLGLVDVDTGRFVPLFV